MATIAYLTNGMASTFNSSLEFSRRLVSVGHDVIYASHVDLASRLQPYGYDFTQLTRCEEIRQAHRTALEAAPGNLINRLFLARRFRQESVAATEIEDFVLARRPDALLIDIEMHYAIIATRRLGTPTALPISWFSIFRAPGFPPLHTTLEPPATTYERWRIEWEWWKLGWRRCLERLPSPKKEALRRRWQTIRYSSNNPSDLIEVANHRGVRLREIASRRHWLHPHLYHDLPIYSMNAKELDFPHDPPSTLSYVGPMVLDNREEEQIHSDGENWLQFIATCRQQRKKILYASLGTYWETNTGFLRQVFEVMQARSDLALIVGLGSKLSPAKLNGAPPNVLLMNYAPQVAVLKEVDGALIHGGITSINECLHFGVPMLVCCADHVDQPGCAARVAFHGVGVFAKTPLSNEVLEQQMDHILCDQGIRGRVEAMQKVYRTYQTDQVAEKAIEKLLGSSR